LHLHSPANRRVPTDSGSSRRRATRQEQAVIASFVFEYGTIAIEQRIGKKPPKTIKNPSAMSLHKRSTSDRRAAESSPSKRQPTHAGGASTPDPPLTRSHSAVEEPPPTPSRIPRYSTTATPRSTPLGTHSRYRGRPTPPSFLRERRQSPSIPVREPSASPPRPFALFVAARRNSPSPTKIPRLRTRGNFSLNSDMSEIDKGPFKDWGKKADGFIERATRRFDPNVYGKVCYARLLVIGALD